MPESHAVPNSVGMEPTIPLVVSPATVPQPPVESAPQPATCEEVDSSSSTQQVALLQVPERPKTSTLIEFNVFENGTATQIRWDPTENYQYAKIDLACFEDWGQRLPFRCDVPNGFASIGETFNYFATRDGNSFHPDSLEVFEPNPFTFASRFRGILARYKTAQLTAWRIDAKGGDTFGQDCGGTMRCTPEGCSPGSTSAILRMQLTENGIPREICTTIFGNWGCGSCQSTQVDPFLDWIKKSDQLAAILPKVTGPSNGQQTWLPKSRQLWSELAPKGADEAITSLESRIIGQKEKISLFGLTASVTSAALAFPIFAIVMLWLITLHLRELRRRLGSLTEITSVQDQWFGFFQDRSAGWTAMSLLFLGPIAVSVLLAWTAIQSPSSGWLCPCILTGVLLVIAGIQFRAMSELRAAFLVKVPLVQKSLPGM